MSTKIVRRIRRTYGRGFINDLIPMAAFALLATDIHKAEVLALVLTVKNQIEDALRRMYRECEFISSSSTLAGQKDVFGGGRDFITRETVEVL